MLEWLDTADGGYALTMKTRLYGTIGTLVLIGLPGCVPGNPSNPSNAAPTAGDSRYIDSDSIDTPAELVEWAMRGEMEGEYYYFGDYMRSIRSHVSGLRDNAQNPFVSWLACKLLQKSLSRDLFALSDDLDLLLLIGEEMGDDAMWYIADIRCMDRPNIPIMQDVLWAHLGSTRITTSVPSFNPYKQEFKLASIGHGDIVEFRLYQFDRSLAIISSHLDVESLLSNPKIKPVLVLPLPVLVGGN